MNRRKAIFSIPLVAGGAFLAYAGFKWMTWNTPADIDYLMKSKKLLTSLTDAIIPKTESPSASECGVVDFVIKMVSQGRSAVAQNRFITGLKELEKYSISTFGKSFAACSEEEQLQILLYTEKNDEPIGGIPGKIQTKLLGKPFFSMLKEFTVAGYFTSEAGANQALRYAQIPTRYTACQPYTAGEKAWATY
jgi:Gluconate 2-dehydrogenase subunit 3